MFGTGTLFEKKVLFEADTFYIVVKYFDGKPILDFRFKETNARGMPSNTERIMVNMIFALRRHSL